MKTHACTAAALALLFACSDQRHGDVSKLQVEVAGLRGELATVKQERDELKFGPAKLLAEAEASILKADWAQAKKQAETLVAKHPGTPEYSKAIELISKANDALAQLTKTQALAEAKRLEEERRQAVQEERGLAAALAKMRKKIDQVENITWYRDQSSSQYSNSNAFYIYFGKHQTDSPLLRLRVQYNADTWLFIESFLVVTDGRRFEYEKVKFNRDHSDKIWEWYDEATDAGDMEVIKSIIASKSAVIRFNGQQYRRDRTITASEKAALQNVLNAYGALGGK